MSNLAIIPPAGSLPYRLTRTGLHIDRALSYEEYEQAVYTAMEVKSLASWAIADLIVYGEQHLADKYTQAFEATGLAMQTLYNYAPVGYLFPAEQRVYDCLHFDHYREVSVKYLDHDTRHALLSKANKLVEGRREYLRDSKREIRNLPARPQAYYAEREVNSDGSLRLVDLPLHLRGKLVKITISLVEDAA